MNKSNAILSAAFFAAIFCQINAQERNNIPITKEKITKNIILFKTGETGAYPNMIAVRTAKGIVVFDALQYPDVARRAREMIRKDFGDEFAYLVNTHGAYDHTGGNETFDDIPIIGHSELRKEIPSFIEQMKQEPTRNFFQEMVNKSESLRATYPGNPKDIDEAIESIRYLLADSKNNSIKAIVPDTLFDEHYVLNMGNKTFEMFHNTPGYSKSDIIIYIPEEKALIIGDIFNKNRLPWLSLDTNLESWENLFSKYIAEDSDIKYFIATHGSVMTIDEVREQFKYLRKLKEEVTRMKKEGKTLEEATTELSLDKFPFLSKLNPYFYGTATHMHNHNGLIFWRQIK